MASDNDLFEEVAKFRATRRLWAKIAKARFGTEDPAVLALRLTVFTNATRLTAQQPLNNIVRTTVHVLASILGGVSRISVPAYDEALALPTFESTWLANIIKHILTDEAMVANTVDPLGGSYYVETLTNEIEAKAQALYDHIDEMGGAISAIESGYYKNEMTEGAYQYLRDVESGRRTIIGVNKMRLAEESSVRLFRHNPTAEADQSAFVRQLRSQRDQAEVDACLLRLRHVVQAKESGEQVNIMPAILSAVRAYATVGEVFGELRAGFGEYTSERIDY